MVYEGAAHGVAVDGKPGQPWAAPSLGSRYRLQARQGYCWSGVDPVWWTGRSAPLGSKPPGDSASTRRLR
jgi:hypothetical protein